MSVLGAMTIDMIEQLKRRTKQWSMTPLVIADKTVLGNQYHCPDHNGIILYKPAPNNVSAITHFINNWVPSNIALIQIKQPKKTLRLIQLELGHDSIEVLYWRVNGYVMHDYAMNKRSTNRYLRGPYDYEVEGYDKLLLCQINHVKRVRGLKEVQKLTFKLCSETPERVYSTIISVIGKSYHWWGMGQSDHFGAYQYQLMVDLEGKNYVFDGNYRRR